jgi:hypothetical protein
MRLVHLMTFVCAMLLLAMIPACVQFARLAGVHPAASLATVGALAAIALLTTKRM